MGCFSPELACTASGIVIRRLDRCREHRRVILVNQPEVYHGSFPAIDGVLSFDAPPEPASLAPPRPLCATFVQIPVERRELVRAEASIENPSLKALN